MKTKITFKKESDTYISIMRDGKKIGHVYSQTSEKQHNTPYPHDDTEYCLNSIQVCGFDRASKIWGCGPFHGKKDIVVSFIPNNEYTDTKKQQYKFYVENKLNKGEVDTIQNFEDWNAHNI